MRSESWFVRFGGVLDGWGALGGVSWRLFLIAFLLLTASHVANAQQIPFTANGDPTSAASNCINAGYNDDINRFSACWVMQMASPQQREIANCIMMNGNWPTAGFCMAGRNLSPAGQAIAQCALNIANQNAPPQMLATCASGPMGVNPEAMRLAGCVAANTDSFWGAAMCVGGQRLTPEQQVFAECAIDTGLQPYAFAACATGQLTINEFQKCLTIGVGGEGCFGNNNAIVQLVRGFWTGVAGGPNSVLNRPGQIFGGPHSVFRDPAQIWGGPNSVFNNPMQILGGPNSVVRNPGQIWGGPNSVVRNPDQLLGGPNSFFHKNLGIHF